MAALWLWQEGRDGLLFFFGGGGRDKGPKQGETHVLNFLTQNNRAIRCQVPQATPLPSPLGGGRSPWRKGQGSAPDRSYGQEPRRMFLVALKSQSAT